MDRVKRARTPARALFTRIRNEIGAELGNDEPAQDTLEVKIKLLEGVYEKLQVLDNQLMELLLDEEDYDDIMEAEQESITKYTEEWITVNLQVDKLIKGKTQSYKTASEAGIDKSPSAKKRNFKLPKIEIKKFNGELTEWLSYWAQFKKIHEDPDIHNSDKFQYLSQSMATGTRAKDLVDSFPQSEDNYPKVIAALEERFGRKRLLKQVYVRELLKMVISNAKTKEKIPLIKMYDKLESYLRALESLGVTLEQTAEFLFPMVESSLPEEILVAWQRSTNYGKDGSLYVPPRTELDFLMQFLRQEVEGEEQRNLARSGFEGMTIVEMKSGNHKKKQELNDTSCKVKNASKSDFATAAGLHTGEFKIACIFTEITQEITP